MVRWLLIYPPVLCLLAGWAWRHLERVHLVPLLVLAIGLALQQYFIHSDRLAAEIGGYDRSPEPWHSGQIKPIVAVGAPIKRTKDEGTPYRGVELRPSFVGGSSNALCYEPMFGYRLENLDRRFLRVSTINVPDRNGLLPMKNPSCYVYPQEMPASPGRTLPPINSTTCGC